MRKKILVITFLFLLWMFLSLLYIFNYSLSLSVISYSHSKSEFKNFTTKRLLSGDKILGEFKAKEDYLGILSINFSAFQQVSYSEEDTLVFRLKEKGSSDWYYEGNYRSGLIYEFPFLPLGFPIIKDSEGRVYEFEIESLRGNEVNAVALSSWEPVLVTRYQIPREILESDTQFLLTFLVKKVLISLTNINVLFFSLIYSLPLVFFVGFFIWPFKQVFGPNITLIQKKLTIFSKDKVILRKILVGFGILHRTFKHMFNSLLIFVVLINIFIIPDLNDIALVIIASLWVFSLRKYDKTLKKTFLLAVSLLMISPIMLLFNANEIAEKAAVWAYAFFVTVAVQIFLDLRKSNFQK